MVDILCCCFKSLCCDGDCFEPKDNWQIDAECRPGEIGAGWLYKRGKGSAVWGKRYFTLTESKLIYYTDPDRLVARGEIIIAGAQAKPSTTRSNQRKQFYFTISHPECGLREFYAKSSSRRSQWMDKINDQSNKLMAYTVYGKLLKQGGMNKNIWQERWCLCTGRFIDYFDNATDNQSKGSIDLINANIREFSLKDQKFCFEIIANNSSKKGMKKYIFAAYDEINYNRWIALIKKASSQIAPANDNMKESFDKDRSSLDEDITNPIQNRDSNSSVALLQDKSKNDTEKVGVSPAKVVVSPTRPTSESIAVINQNKSNNDSLSSARSISKDIPTSPLISQSTSTQSTSVSQPNRLSAQSVSSSARSLVQQKTKPNFKEGYLEKLSPARFKGYQRRYFVLKDPGMLLYYGTETDAKNDVNPKGDIQIADILPGSSGVEVTNKNEIVLRLLNRSFTLRASTKEEADSWADIIKAWIAYKSED